MIKTLYCSPLKPRLTATSLSKALEPNRRCGRRYSYLIEFKFRLQLMETVLGIVVPTCVNLRILGQSSLGSMRFTPVPLILSYERSKLTIISFSTLATAACKLSKNVSLNLDSNVDAWA
mgnify:CR=1 FL=1